MADEDPRALSRKLLRRFRTNELKRDRSARASVAEESFHKIDRVLQRELGLAEREVELAQLWNEKPPRPKRLRVIVSMRGRSTSSAAAPGDRKGVRRETIRRQRMAGQRALDRLLPELEGLPGARIGAKHWLTRSAAIEIPAASLAEVAERADLRWIANDKKMIVIALDASRPLIGADQVENNLNIIGREVNVAVLDTGIDFTHAALAPPMGNQLDFSGEGTGDFHGHGTHCGGVVASNDRVRRGVAPGCTLHDYKLMDASGGANPSNCVTAIQTAVADRMQVLSNSWGFSHANGAWTCPDGTCVLCTAANAAFDAGVVFVVAAGNEDNDTCATYDTHIRCPGHATNGITVAASDKSDVMASFSSIGPAADGRPKPDITAPGDHIVSCRASTGSDMNGQAPVVDGVWCDASGTSMACPHVAGVAALMLERNAALTPAQIAGAMIATVVNIGASADEMGAGRIDALAAVSSV